MFAPLSPAAQQDVASFLPIDGQPITVAALLAILQECEGTFQRWRYMHEGGDLVFREGKIVCVIRAVYQSIVRLRPDLAPLPGVIVDPDRPVKWHLPLPR
jgi:hypothetical protein